METLWLWPLVVAASYLLGSLNGALLISRFILHIDIRDYGSGSAGATNSLRVMGKRMTLAVMIIDILKGVAAAMLGFWLLGEHGRLIGGACACLGHNFPIFYKFKGGKGILTSAAVLLCVDYRLLLIALAVFLICTIPTRYVSLGSMTAAVSLPVATALLHRRAWPILIFSLIISAMALVMHRSNMVRLAHKTENKLSFKNGSIQKRRNVS